MAVAILALQGAFIEHKKKLEALGAECFEIRQASDLERPFDRVVLPGGESTTQAKLLHELGLMDPLRKRIEEGIPVLAPPPKNAYRLRGLAPCPSPCAATPTVASWAAFTPMGHLAKWTMSL